MGRTWSVKFWVKETLLRIQYGPHNYIMFLGLYVLLYYVVDLVLVGLGRGWWVVLGLSTFGLRELFKDPICFSPIGILCFWGVIFYWTMWLTRFLLGSVEGSGPDLVC